jgi:hypothetical protein
MPRMDDLAGLATTVTGFATAENLTVVPTVPEHDCGPEVCLTPDELDLPGFLALAGKLGGGVVYLRAVPFDPDSELDQPDDPPARLTARKGQIGQISVAFAANGLIHFWEDRAAWYLEWEQLADSSVHADGYGPEGQTERLDAEERARLAGELAEAILANPQFRVASRGDRQRLARLALPAGTDHWASWDAVREACDRAQQMTETACGQLQDRLDELAAELLATPAWQQASSPAARKQAAGQFLVPHADGFSPTPLVRDELYARAQRLAKAARAGASGLF